MDRIASPSSPLDLPTPHEAARAVHQARRLWGRILASWASDVLALRRRHELQARWSEPFAEPGFWHQAA